MYILKQFHIHAKCMLCTEQQKCVRTIRSQTPKEQNKISSSLYITLEKKNKKYSSTNKHFNITYSTYITTTVFYIFISDNFVIKASLGLGSVCWKLGFHFQHSPPLMTIPAMFSYSCKI